MRIEQLAPFHFDEFKQEVSAFKNAVEFVWFQEEHRNSGAWNYLFPRLEYILSEMKKEGKIKDCDIKKIIKWYQFLDHRQMLTATDDEEE